MTVRHRASVQTIKVMEEFIHSNPMPQHHALCGELRKQEHVDHTPMTTTSPNTCSKSKVQSQKLLHPQATNLQQVQKFNERFALLLRNLWICNAPMRSTGLALNERPLCLKRCNLFVCAMAPYQIPTHTTNPHAQPAHTYIPITGTHTHTHICIPWKEKTQRRRHEVRKARAHIQTRTHTDTGTHSHIHTQTQTHTVLFVRIGLRVFKNT